MGKTTLGQILAQAPAANVAFRAPDRPALNYGDLCEFVCQTGGALRVAGVSGADRVAIVLPNGAEMATAFLAVANCAIAAPLNPAYKQDEFAFYIQDLNASLLICGDADGPAALAAKSLGIKVAVAGVSETSPAGIFTLDIAAGAPVTLSDAGAASECLVLHTSGTTSRPKIVPLSHANVSASAQNVATSLALVQGDICLNVMPLFHIHGLIAAVSSTMAAGAGIYCTPGFNALKFFGWMSDCEPSWYTAVPTMHQAILARAGRNKDVVAGSKLRLIRSSSSSLPPIVMTELRATFGCPVVEAYGMTEAAHQMACNPLEDGKQIAGSVGVAAGPKIAILTGNGLTNDADIIGEIVINGANVTSGYDSNDKANAESFLTDKGSIWFRTGDQGRFDGAGYLFITGRLKEIINRGGEKISPREVDEVLMDHPSVSQAVTFATVHKQLGEDVAAAVVLKEGCEADPAELRSFTAERLVAFKVPRKILILDEIPKGPTGKLQRIGLAKTLGLEE
jgi:acyl-CoA synthetase (AMP-forming)/AMP-acid ligase II